MTIHTVPTRSAKRIDIQALRGLAILLVLLHHTKLVAPLQAGFLGVDVFFVVSGYLITGIVLRGLEAGAFSFTAFYIRRAKRLLPAAYVTFVVTALASAFFLTRPEMRDFTWQLLGAVTFTGNIVLWMQTGYFEGAAHLKPLLHVWSLSIEEQYYLLLPAALVFTPRRFWPAGGLVIFCGSLALCLLLVSVKPGATFYLLPMRAWELALGSLGILILEGSMAGVWLGRLFWPACATLLLVPFFPTGTPHPGLDALMVSSATLIVILRQHPLLNQSLPARGLAKIGDISYSLYLVHWPLLAFAANAWVSPVPDAVRLGLVALAVVLALALFRWVEEPARQATFPINRLSLAATLAASSAVVMIGFAVYYLESLGDQVDYNYQRRGNLGLNVACESGETFVPKPECQSSETPGILIWGDSYAMHLVEGILATTDLGLIQATKTTCGPLMSISSYRPEDGFYNKNWGLGCLKFNRSVINYLASADSVQVVVLSSFLGQYLAGNRILVEPPFVLGDIAPAVPIEDYGSEDIALSSLRTTIAAIRALGKRVVLVSPPPTSFFDIGRCLERKALGKVTFGANKDGCSIAEDQYRDLRSGVLKLLARAAEEDDVPVVKLDEYLCRSGNCSVEIDGTFLYSDGGHLSHEGSRLLGQRIDLANLLMAIAR